MYLTTFELAWHLRPQHHQQLQHDFAPVRRPRRRRTRRRDDQPTTGGREAVLRRAVK